MQKKQRYKEFIKSSDFKLTLNNIKMNVIDLKMCRSVKE